ncbi:hypothetical protein TNCV_3527551 [Trichonephila clavipes]|nr:hypothetical protein TNCV_3527551 [Trichonephila clavipes]
MKFYFPRSSFSVVLSVINLFLWTTTQHVIEHSLFKIAPDSEGIQRLVWPERCPDLNPIENVWDALGRQVAGRNYPPTNKNTLIRALTEEWDKLPQQLLDNIMQSMIYDVWNVPSHSTVDISSTHTFFKVPADF